MEPWPLSEGDNFLFWSIIFLGDHDRRIDEGEQTIKVSKIIVHEGYQDSRFNNDIALMQLAQPAKFGRNVQPVCLPNQGESPEVGSKCYITGKLHKNNKFR